MLSATRARLLELPKAELHVHLDGSLRPETMLELAEEREVPLPAEEPTTLADYMRASDTANLEEYLARFRLTLALMQDGPAVERIAYELAEDHVAEAVRYVEVRFCPGLHTEQGMHVEDALDAALAGLARAARDLDVRTGVIVCALRSLPASASREMAELAVAHRDRGVCAFDLAGAEAGNPVSDHLDAIDIAHGAGLPITIHAGEGYGKASIREALELGHARRIGHGTRLYEDPELEARVREDRVPLEVCITSNVQTRVVTAYEAHPVRRYFDERIPITLCTDNRLMSAVTLTDEYEHARDALGFTWEELVSVARAGFECAFVGPEVRVDLLRRFDDGVAAIS